MSSTVTRIDYGAARKRLQVITTDSNILEGFARLVRLGDLDDAFLEASYAARMSFDHLLVGTGEPFMTVEAAA